ncbi:hypothetical protein Hanom_Chr03g00193441 [Helianthus anomalus]
MMKKMKKMTHLEQVQVLMHNVQVIIVVLGSRQLTWEILFLLSLILVVQVCILFLVSTPAEIRACSCRFVGEHGGGGDRWWQWWRLMVVEVVMDGGCFVM